MEKVWVLTQFTWEVDGVMRLQDCGSIFINALLIINVERLQSKDGEGVFSLFVILDEAMHAIYVRTLCKG